MGTDGLVVGLLIGRIVSSAFLIDVLRQQWRLLRSNDPPSLQSLRRRLFGLSIPAVVCNIVAMSLDVAALLGISAWWFVFLYAYTNNLSFLMVVIALWASYRAAKAARNLEIQQLLANPKN